MIYHIAFSSDWEAAQGQGEYTNSTKGRTLEQQGFIHAGTIDQVAPVANMIYRGDTGLVVLFIDPERLGSTLTYDEVPGWEEPFPHIYGPLNTDAVVEVRPLIPGSDGMFRFTG